MNELSESVPSKAKVNTKNLWKARDAIELKNLAKHLENQIMTLFQQQQNELCLYNYYALLLLSYESKEIRLKFLKSVDEQITVAFEVERNDIIFQSKFSRQEIVKNLLEKFRAKTVKFGKILSKKIDVEVVQKEIEFWDRITISEK